jgi:uncharacterized protein (TIGR03083 family)
MGALSYDRYCAEIAAQTDLLASAIKGADLTVPVPSCPGWNVGQLARHLGGAQRWAHQVITTRATQPVPEPAEVRELSRYAGEDPGVLGPWLADGAAQLADALRAAGAGAPIWTPVSGGSSDFYARRFTYETAIHRADAVLALGEHYALDPDVAIDGIDEWMELGSLPIHFEIHPRMRELLGPGRTLHLHATDTPPDAGAEWVVDLTGDVIAWRRAHEKAAVAVRGPLTDLLLIIYKRRPPAGEGVEILGDAALLDFWLERVSFG